MLPTTPRPCLVFHLTNLPAIEPVAHFENLGGLRGVVTTENTGLLTIAGEGASGLLRCVGLNIGAGVLGPTSEVSHESN